MVKLVTDKPLQLTVDRYMDNVVAIEFGQVIDGKLADEYLRLDDDFAFVLNEPGGDLIGFVADGAEAFDPEALDAIWDGPRFDVPILGLTGACAGEIVLSAAATFPGISTADAELFAYAVEEQGVDFDKLTAWRACLAAGNLKAHFAVGYTLCEHERFHGAYRHLRIYTELVPSNSWAWSWLGQACVGLGHLDEARAAYERAIELERLGSFETDAAELLGELQPKGT